MVAVRSIQRITKTMQMIANTKFARAAHRAQATRPYTDRIERLVGEVIAAAGDVDHPLMRGPEKPAGRQLLLLIASDRGLCGAYNAHVLRTAHPVVKELQAAGTGFALEVAGKKAVAFLKFHRIEIERRHQIGDTPRYETVKELADRYLASFLAGEFDAIRVVSVRFISASRQVPQVIQLLPLQAQESGGAGASGATGRTDQTTAAGTQAGLYEFSPSSTALLDDLLPRSVRTRLFQAFIDAAVSEQIMRMVAMKAATENARGLGRSLRRKYNRARQSRITTELMEVISGAAALE
jgi:F-type H+-transporting ATPase subunit gamma